MYCFRADLPLKGIMASSMLTARLGRHTAAKWSPIIFIIGATLPSFSYPGLPGGVRVLLSAMCSYRWRS